VRFGPNDSALGGSEQAVVYLSTAFVQQGYSVTVYGNVEPCIKDGVCYLRHEEFVHQDKFSTIILWRRYGLEALPRLQAAKSVLVDLHDPTDPAALPKDLVQLKVKRIMVKSNYHRGLYQHLPDALFTIVPNGLRPEHIMSLKPQISARSKDRFCYTSSYDRGLVPILKYMWPAIKRARPNAEFHIRYGSDLLPKPVKDELGPLLLQPGVYEHKRSSYDDTIMERYNSFAQLYVSGSPLEIDCLSVREAALTGCIPVLSNVAVFPERTGVHIEGDPNSQSTLEAAAQTVLGLLNLPDDKLNHFTTAVFSSAQAQAQPWTEIAVKWLAHI